MFSVVGRASRWGTRLHSCLAAIKMSELVVDIRSDYEIVTLQLTRPVRPGRYEGSADGGFFPPWSPTSHLRGLTSP